MPCSFLLKFLGGSSTAQLYRSLVVDQNVASSAGAWFSADALDFGTFGLSASPRPGVSLEKVEAALRAEVKKLLKDGVSEKRA